MSIISMEIPENIKTKFWIWDKITYANFIIKTLWEEYISPDLEFTNYEKMNKNHKIEFDKLENIDKSKLLNL